MTFLVLQLFSKEALHLEEQEHALSQIQDTMHRKNFFRWNWTNSLEDHILFRFLVTFVTRTFNVSSFCIALYCSMTFLETLQIAPGKPIGGHYISHNLFQAT